MKANRFSEAQIVAIIQQQQTGLTVAQIIREHGIREATAPAARLLQLDRIAEAKRSMGACRLLRLND